MVLDSRSLLLLFDIFIYTVCKDGRCFRENNKTGHISPIHDIDFFCCANYEHSDGKCVECQTGLTSTKNKPCKPCQDNSYGQRCTEKCKCTETQRCDNVIGCVMYLSTSSHISEYVYQSEASSLPLTYPKTTVQSPKNDTLEGMQIKAVLIYIICAGLVTLIVTVGVVRLIYRSKRRCKKNIRVQQIQNTQNFQSEQYITVL
ncbi:uncharacterized protein LOC127714696 [Mytilus californianus]|uniref:uncharacterized protein LOC127714696 n=1 Tax=Mytilus californianus TaxID=6549 RepID=UPI0022482FC6|nr:uncharacterized protein LOC127714696 [Mytilus californianus]